MMEILVPPVFVCWSVSLVAVVGVWVLLVVLVLMLLLPVEEVFVMPLVIIPPLVVVVLAPIAGPLDAPLTAVLLLTGLPLAEPLLAVVMLAVDVPPAVLAMDGVLLTVTSSGTVTVLVTAMLDTRPSMRVVVNGGFVTVMTTAVGGARDVQKSKNSSNLGSPCMFPTISLFSIVHSLQAL